MGSGTDIFLSPRFLIYVSSMTILALWLCPGRGLLPLVIHLLMGQFEISILGKKKEERKKYQGTHSKPETSEVPENVWQEQCPNLENRGKYEVNFFSTKFHRMSCP